jgi:hypothetical protein
MNHRERNFNNKEQRGEILLPEKENGQKISPLPLFGPVQKHLAPKHIR